MLRTQFPASNHFQASIGTKLSEFVSEECRSEVADYEFPIVDNITPAEMIKDNGSYPSYSSFIIDMAFEPEKVYPYDDNNFMVSLAFKDLYEDKLTLFKKIEKIAVEIYRASEVVADTKIRQQLKDFEEKGFGNLPVCIAKTQYSFSTDPSLKGAPSDHVLPVREVRLSSGAEFIVIVCGEIMTMPGLPKVPAADSIKLNKKGEIEGLF